MCLAQEALQDSGASPSSNGCPSREAEGLCVASLVRNEKDGAPEIPEVILPTSGTSSPVHNRSSKYCWYRRSGRKLCSRFRRTSAKVLPETTETAEIDSIEAGSPSPQDVFTEVEETAPNSPASGCKQQKETDQDKATKPGGGSWFGRLLLLYSGNKPNDLFVYV